MMRMMRWSRPLSRRRRPTRGWTQEKMEALATVASKHERAPRAGEDRCPQKRAAMTTSN